MLQFDYSIVILTLNEQIKPMNAHLEDTANTDADLSAELFNVTRNFFDAADGDRNLTRHRVVKFLLETDDDRIKIWLFNRAVKGVIRDIDHAERRRQLRSVDVAATDEQSSQSNPPAENAATPKAAQDQAAIVSLRNRNIINRYNFPLFGGLRLGDATKADLVESRQRWTDSAKQNSRRAEMMDVIIDKIKAGKTVFQSIPHGELNSIMNEFIGASE